MIHTRGSNAPVGPRREDFDLPISEPKRGAPVCCFAVPTAHPSGFGHVAPLPAGSIPRVVQRILDRARAQGVPLLWVRASLTEEPAFAALGFVARRREQVTIGGEVLDRFEMEMIL